MENFSIYKYMKLGIVHFKAYPQATTGEGPIVETLRKIVEDDFWTAVEVGWMKDPKVRHEATKLLETSHMEVCYANQPRMFSLKLNINDLDPKERKKAIGAMKNGVDEAFQLGATCMRVFSGKHPGEEKKEEAKKILIDSLKEICRYTNEQGPMEIYMKVFDKEIDKCFLIGDFPDAADVAAEVNREFGNFGVLADLSHFALFGNNPRGGDSPGEDVPHALPHRERRLPRPAPPGLRGSPAPVRHARRRGRYPPGECIFPASARSEAPRSGEEAGPQRGGETASGGGDIGGRHRQHQTGDQRGLGNGIGRSELHGSNTMKGENR